MRVPSRREEPFVACNRAALFRENFKFEIARGNPPETPLIDRFFSVVAEPGLFCSLIWRRRSRNSLRSRAAFSRFLVFAVR